MSSTALVIGAGMGGLAAACDLARAGLSVTVVEKASTPGGKMRRLSVAGRAIDAGPTVFTMRWVFEALFADGGGDLAASVNLRAATRLARHAWPDGSRLDLFADAARTEAAIGAFAGVAAAKGWREFLAYAATIYAEVEAPFIRGPRPTMSSLVAARGLGLFGALKRIDSWRTMWRALGRFFPDPRLRQLFARYATYCGSSPFAAPATLNLIAHVEHEGVWLVEGGIHRLAEAVAHLAASLGVRFRYDAEVARIEGEGAVTGIELASGERLPADLVVLNAGHGALAGGHLGPVGRAAARSAPSRSLSAITWCAVGTTSGLDLGFHNVFFSPDYAAEFAELAAGRVPRSPTVYVCAQDRDGFGPGPTGSERLFVLVNAPPDGDDGPRPERLERATADAFAHLERLGLTVTREAEVITGPAEFARMFPGTGGGLYGPPTHGWRASLERPGVRTRVPGLYIAGGEAHPGAGVPMATLGGRLAARAALEDLRR